MKNLRYKTTARIGHFFKARPKGGYGIHSPYVFDFVNHVLYDHNPYYCFRQIEKLRGNLLRDDTEIYKTDFGTGTSGPRRISRIARTSCMSSSDCRILFRAAVWLRAETMLELGTSLGISACYLAKTNSRAEVVSMEGCPECAKIARANFKNLGISNVRVVEGDISLTLDATLESLSKPIDLLFIDANHTEAATLEYFEKAAPRLASEAIVIIDDIHSSPGMKRAWDSIRNSSEAKADIDIYGMGILIFHPEVQKGHYRIKY